MVTTFTNDTQRDKGTTPNFSITDWAEDYSLDCNTDAVTVTNNVLGTLIRDLMAQGILKGTVVTAA